MDFQESVNYLYSLGNEVSAMKLGLENPRKLFQALGNPQLNFQRVQVAGTNGKGSVCAFLDAICRSANIKTGLYTSPHLISITERIKIDGQEISENEFAGFATKVRQVTEKEQIPATFFEQITAIALLAFAENKVDLAILETGLGGRLDATTAANAEIVAITPIDYDHQQYLGNTLTEIAGEKAAIINSPLQKVVVSKQSPEAEKIILERCKKFEIEPFRTNFELPKIKLSLKGDFQNENAKVAIGLAEILRIDKNNIFNGLETAKHQGRLEFSHGILFDGAHNPAGAKALREYLERFYSDSKITLIFGAMNDKQINEIAEILFPLAETLIFTQPQNSRSATVGELSEIAKKIGVKTQIFSIPKISEAIQKAREISANYASGIRSLICVTGSLYLVGESQKILNETSENL